MLYNIISTIYFYIGEYHQIIYFYSANILILLHYLCINIKFVILRMSKN